MKIDIQVISRDIICPSIPTPNDLTHYNLSYIDQMNPPVHTPHVLFYQNSDTSNYLKKSLSQTLSLFYPLSGRLVDNNYVDCNDEGVTYVEARANCKLLDVISEPIPEEFSKFLPSDMHDLRDQCLVIQVTFFSCGGMAIGVGFSHKIGDAWSCFMFLNTWAAMSREDDARVITPKFDSATLFPPRDFASWKPRTNSKLEKEDIVTKRFLFNAEMINELKVKYTKNNNNEDSRGLRRPTTRIEALSAFIWTRYVVSTQIKDDPTKTCTLLQTVNLRKRVVPPLPDHLFGNLYRPVTAVPCLKGDEEGTYTTYGIVEKIRESIKSIDVTKLQEGTEHLKFMNNNIPTKKEVVPFVFTSMCRFPLYEADFGWEKPVWVGSASLMFKNVVIFLDSYSGNGIEAWVNLNMDDMAKFEADKDLLAYVAN